jgi:elongation factor Ts
MLVRRSRASTCQGAVGAYVHNGRRRDRTSAASACWWPSKAPAIRPLQELGRKIALHVAATAPLSLSTDDLDPAAVEKERAIFTEQAMESGKPPNVVEKMVEGRIRKFYEEVVLLKQAFVMNPDQTDRAAGGRNRQGARLAGQGGRLRPPGPRRRRGKEDRRLRRRSGRDGRRAS